MTTRLAVLVLASVAGAALAGCSPVADVVIFNPCTEQLEVAFHSGKTLIVPPLESRRITGVTDPSGTPAADIHIGDRATQTISIGSPLDGFRPVVVPASLCGEAGTPGTVTPAPSVATPLPSTVEQPSTQTPPG